MSESDISKQIRSIIRPSLGRLLRINGAKLKGAAGYPVSSYYLYHPLHETQWKEELVTDFVGFTTNGKFVAIEVKDPKRKIDKAKAERERKQNQFIEAVNFFGGIGRVVESAEDAENLVKLLKVGYEQSLCQSREEMDRQRSVEIDRVNRLWIELFGNLNAARENL